MKKRYIPLLITLLFLGINSGSTFAQEGFGGGQRIRTQNQAPRRERQAKETMVKVESVVKDANGNALANVLVSGKEGVIEVMTDKDGKFSISIPENTSLLFEADGFESQQLPITNTSPATVVLTKAEFLMEEKNMVNIAFGQVRKKELIGAVSTVNPKELKKTDDTDLFYDAITGKIPGMIGNNIIRGLTATNTFSPASNVGGNSALIIVDGVQRDPSYLSLNEIEQISVLKDGNAAMLWGSRARNGVILVTTRRGTANKRKIEVTYERGMMTPVAEPKYLGSADYMTLNNEARVNDGLSKSYADSTIARYRAGTNPYRYPSIDYYSSTFLKSSKPFQNILTEMSGGNETTQYYANLGWKRSGSLFNLGDARFFSYNQINMRANVDFKVNEYLKARIDAVIIFVKDKQPNADFWGNATSIHPDYFTPLLPISLLKTKPWSGITAAQTTALNNLPGQAKVGKKIYNAYLLGGTSSYASNPYGLMYKSGYSMDNRRTATVNASVEADLKNITQGLTFKTFMSFDVLNRFLVRTGQTYAVYTPTWNRFGTIDQNGTQVPNDSIIALTQVGTDVNPGTQSIPTFSTTLNGVRTLTPYFERRIGVNAQFDYDRTFGGAHHVTATLMTYWDRWRRDAIMIDDKDAYVGFRGTYDYKQKYMVDFSSTYMNNYRLKPGSRGAYEPSVGVAWNMSEEDWMKDSKCVDYLKLRASAAIQDLDPNLGEEWIPWKNSFGTDIYYSFNDATRGGSGDNLRGVIINRADNFGLTYEKMKSANAGLEGYFFNRLLYLDANVFMNRWQDQVVRRTNEYPAWIGSNNPYENNNVTDYKGAEIGVTLSKTFGKFSVELEGNLLYATSKRVKYSELVGEKYLAQTGRPGDVIFGLVDLGLFKNTQDISSFPRQTWSTVKPGDIRYKDQNGDNKIDANDRVQIGNSQPKYNYGLNLVLKYGDLSLMATGNGAAAFQYFLSGTYFWEQGNDKYSTEVLNRWTPATALTATYPRLSSAASTNNFQNSTYWLQNGNYFRLNRLQLTYEVPKRLVQNWPTKEISLYLRGSNLIMWTTNQFKRQLSIGAEPNYHSYALGVNILF
jgi:TonB-linked SusC/RagA family outer membrane protein